MTLAEVDWAMVIVLGLLFLGAFAGGAEGEDYPE